MRDEDASSEGSAAGPPSGAIQGAPGLPATTAANRVGPGWYADPNTEGQLRYWDGQVWTAAVAAISDAGARPQPGADGSPFVKQPPAHAPISGLWERNLPEKNAFDRLQQALRQCGGEVKTNEREGWIEATLLWKGARRRHRFTFDDARHTVWVTGTDGSASFASSSQGDDALREEMLTRLWSLYDAAGPEQSRARKSRRRAWALGSVALIVLAAAGAATALFLAGLPATSSASQPGAASASPLSSDEPCDGSGCTDDGRFIGKPGDAGDDSSGEVETGANLITVPNVIGLDWYTANDELKHLGFRVANYALGSGACGQSVVQQTPAGGETLAAGSLVSVGRQVVPCSWQ